MFCIFLQKTFVIQDLFLYRETITETTSSNPQFFELADLDGLTNVEITGTISASDKGFGLSYANTLTDSDDMLRIGVDGSNYLLAWSLINNNNTNHTASLNQRYTTNSDLDFIIKRIGDATTLSIKGYSYNFTYAETLRYVHIVNWNNTGKTITVKNLKIKAL